MLNWIKKNTGTLLISLLLGSILSLQVFTVYELSIFSNSKPIIMCEDCSRRQVIDLEIAEQMVRHKFSNLNNIDIIIDDLKYAVKFEDDELETVQTKSYTFREHSYLFLLMISIAYNESRFDTHVIGLAGELSAFQIKPSTAKYLVEKRNFPIFINSDNIDSELENNKKATFLAIKYVKEHLSLTYLTQSLSKYNGDRTTRYGKRIKNTFDKIVRGDYV